MRSSAFGRRESTAPAAYLLSAARLEGFAPIADGSGQVVIETTPVHDVASLNEAIGNLATAHIQEAPEVGPNAGYIRLSIN